MKGNKPFPLGNLFKFSHKPIPTVEIEKVEIEKVEEEYLLELAPADKVTAELMDILLIGAVTRRRGLEAGLLRAQEIRREYERTHATGKENR